MPFPSRRGSVEPQAKELRLIPGRDQHGETVAPQRGRARHGDPGAGHQRCRFQNRVGKFPRPVHLQRQRLPVDGQSRPERQADPLQVVHKRIALSTGWATTLPCQRRCGRQEVRDAWERVGAARRPGGAFFLEGKGRGSRRLCHRGKRPGCIDQKAKAGKAADQIAPRQQPFQSGPKDGKAEPAITCSITPPRPGESWRQFAETLNLDPGGCQSFAQELRGHSVEPGRGVATVKEGARRGRSAGRSAGGGSVNFTRTEGEPGTD